MTDLAFKLDTTTTTVVSVAANITNGYVAGNNTVLDNSTLKYPAMQATLYVSGWSVAPTANAVVELWIARQDVDGTADDTAGSGVSSTPASPTGTTSSDGAELVGVFPVAASTSPQRVTRMFRLRNVAKAKFFVRNQTGQTITAGSGTELTVKATLATETAA